ncbi:hypothetical protein IV203_020147 [Nitzschia inconspicua]|uniref:Uncharacterized protein n=1 Tax=Nitzschia inconspicua TaxID=303405 RepID=A0A9K3Q4Z2_9STRA|nr:hypothetical protein IV203_020337 [Nitzschia inconspicua]KAG7371577.1 hypothetical protein IV203_020147 [Nitzschia inconspicua]
MQEKGTEQSFSFPAPSVRSASALSFNPFVLTRFVPNLDDITSDEQEDLWYSRADYKHIRRREQSLMEQVSKQAKSQQHQQHFMAQRVLGIQTSQERAARCKNIRKTQLFVLAEQERHQRKNPDQLALAYCERSKECAQRAQERGMDVEIFLRDLDLAYVEASTSHGDMCSERGRPPAPGNLGKVSPAMKDQRWSADSSSSTSHSPSSNRGGSSCNVAEMMNTNDHQSSPPMTVVDVPLHITLQQQMRRRHAGDIVDETRLPDLYHPRLPQRRKLDYAAALNLSHLSPIL